MAALGLRCCTWAFSSCSEWGLLIAMAPPVAEHGLQGTWASVFYYINIFIVCKYIYYSSFIFSTQKVIFISF